MLRESRGRVLTVSDGEALAAVEETGAAEGLFVEPSSAVAWVALRRLAAEDGLDGTTVALARGSGFRETHVLPGHRPPRREQVDLARLEETLAALARNAP